MGQQVRLPPERPESIHMQEGRVKLLIMSVAGEGNTDLAEIAFASGGFRGVLRSAQSRQQKGCEDADSRNDDQQLDQSEPASRVITDW